MNGTPSGVFVGNGFIRSERLVELRCRMNGIFWNLFLTFYHSTCRIRNNHVSECMNAFPTKVLFLLPFNGSCSSRKAAERINAFPTKRTGRLSHILIKETLLEMSKADKHIRNNWKIMILFPALCRIRLRNERINLFPFP